MRLAWWYAAVGAAASVVAVLWPLSPALGSADVFLTRLLAVLLTWVVCAATALLRNSIAFIWLAAALLSATAGVAAALMHFNAAGRCVALYDHRPVIIGREFTDHGADYVNRNPGITNSDLLLDSGGKAEIIWKKSSIDSCRRWLSWGGLAAVPLFAACICALIVRSPPSRRFIPARASTAAPPTPTAPVYDAFLSYRHTEPDRGFALDLMQALERHGLRTAVDFRDFRPNEHFLTEMERCIKQSRFTLCVVTSQYLASDHCSEEAIISKTLDLAERRKRVVPLIFERVELPVWLHGLVGIDFTESALVDPIERVKVLLSPNPA